MFKLLNETGFDVTKRQFIGFDRSNSKFDSQDFDVQPISLEEILTLERANDNDHQPLKVVQEPNKSIFVQLTIQDMVLLK